MDISTLSEADRFVLFMYKFIIPFVGIVVTFILGMIAWWIRNISKDMGDIKLSIVKHDAISSIHSIAITKLQDNDEKNKDAIQRIFIHLAETEKHI